MIYAVNMRTKEHRIAYTGQSWDASEWDLLGADPDGWIKWHGGECPLPDGAECEVRFLCGGDSHKTKAWTMIWEHHECGGDIIAYRPILDAFDKPDPPLKDKPWWSVYQPEPPTWNGESWPPPIGAIVESRDDTGVSRAEVISIRGGKVIGCCVKNHLAGWLMEEDWRPIRSEEDRAVDKALDAISAERGDRGYAEGVVLRMIRAGYRKEDV